MIDEKPLIEWATFRTLNDHLSQMCFLGVCKLCARISGPILAGLFLFIGIMTFSISCGLYDSKKDDRFEYIPPPATVIAFHWMCCIFGTFFGLSLLLLSFKGTVGLILLIISSIFLLLFWICYMVFFFLSDQFKMSDEAVSVETLQDLWAGMVKTCPYADVYGSGVYIRHYYVKGSRRTSRTPCRTRSFRIQSEPYCNDATTLLDLTPSLFDDIQAFRVFHDVYPEFESEEDDDILSEARSHAFTCLENNYKLSSQKANVDYGVSPVPSMIFLTKDGKKPAAVSRGRAIAAGIFFCGITYSYGISRIPILRQKVYKTNVSLIRRSLDTMCAEMGSCD